MSASRISRLSKSLAVIAFSLAANTSFAELIAVDTEVVQLMPRDWGFTVRISPTAAQQLQAQGVSCIENSAPVILLTKASYKATSDALMLAYATKKKVRIYVERVPALAPDGAVCLNGFSPKINAIDVSDF